MTQPGRPPFPLTLSRRNVMGLAGVGALSLLAACSGSSSGPTGSPSSTTGEVTVTFPRGFGWGAATAAFQVEGATTEDGRGPSIWDTFAAKPGFIADGSTGDPATDHYHRWRDDLDLLAELGLTDYRFSIAWPRILPSGTGAVNQPGIDFYRDLIAGLTDRGIRPTITLYHWDLPQPLADAGGWVSRDTAQHFADYAAVVFDAFGDVDATWLTINEPKTTAWNGFRWGVFPPAVRDEDKAVAVAHHQLLGHGLAVEAFRASGAAGRIGAALNLMPVYPEAGAETAAANADAVENTFFLDPVLLGRYPDNAIGTGPGQIGADADTFFGSVVHEGDLATISAPCDVLAVQYYGVSGVSADGGRPVIHPTSAASWQQIWAPGLYDLLTRIAEDYPAIPLIITECGIPDDDPAGVVEDPDRIDFLGTHLVQAADAIADGVDLQAFFAWSFLDNFEWREGMSQHWGIVHVDTETLERTPKSSAHWLGAAAAANAVTAVRVE